MLLAAAVLALLAPTSSGQGAVALGERLELLERRIEELESGPLDAVTSLLDRRIAEETEGLRPGGAALRFESADERFEMRVGGRIQFDAVWSLAGAGPGRLDDAFLIRRGRLELRGLMHGRVAYRIGVEMRGDRPSLRPAWLEFRELPFGTLRIGKTREPFGLEANVGTNHLDFLERGAVADLAPGRQTGLLAFDTLGAGGPRWAFGLFRTTGPVGSSDPPDDGTLAATGRLSAPILRDGTTLLHLGVAFTIRHPGAEGLRYASRPGVGTGAPVLDTGRLAVEDAYGAALEAAWVHGGWRIQAEAALVHLELPRDRAADLLALQFQASWVITGESREYRESSGTFGRLRPERPFPDGPGAWEISLRLDRLDLEARPLRAGVLDTLSLGVSWHLDGRLRATLAWILADARGGARRPGTGQLLALRLQIDF